MQQTPLRHLALSVDEPEPGLFHWMILESEDAMKTWFVLEASDDAYDTFSEAWEDGAATLRGMGDGQYGPRAEVAEDESADPVLESGPGVDD